jgi:hypothetical protein
MKASMPAPQGAWRGSFALTCGFVPSLSTEPVILRESKYGFHGNDGGGNPGKEVKRI